MLLSLYLLKQLYISHAIQYEYFTLYNEKEHNEYKTHISLNIKNFIVKNNFSF